MGFKAAMGFDSKDAEKGITMNAQQTNAIAAPHGAAIVLRDYQLKALDKVCQAFETHSSALLVMATGLGKTVVFASIIERLRKRGMGRVLVLAHREEIIFQAKDTIEAVAMVDVGIEMGDFKVREDFLHRHSVVVGSIQTQMAGRKESRRMLRFDPTQFDLVIVDEAHHATSNSYRQVIDYYKTNPKCKVLGVTATPDRTDETALGEVFATVAAEVSIRDGITEGWLVPISQRIVHVGALDYSNCRTTAGDLNGADLDAALQYEEVLHGMVFPMLEIAQDKRCLIFAASVSHAHRIAEIINRHRAGSAVTIDASTPKDERRTSFNGFSEGRYQFLVNVGVATEGWDDSALDRKGVQIVVMMRATKSRALYSQMLGRGTRPLPKLVDGIERASERREAIAASAKPRLIVLDFCGSAGRHKLVHAVDALAGKAAKTIRERAEDNAMNMAAVDAVDVLAVIDAAEIQLMKEASAKKRKGIVVTAEYHIQEIDPFSLIDLAPDREQAWAKGAPASEKQLAYLRRMKVGIPHLVTKQEASKLINAMMAVPSPAQCRLLMAHGFNPEQYDRKSASTIIDSILNRR